LAEASDVLAFDEAAASWPLEDYGVHILDKAGEELPGILRVSFQVRDVLELGKLVGCGVRGEDMRVVQAQPGLVRDGLLLLLRLEVLLLARTSQILPSLERGLLYK